MESWFREVSQVLQENAIWVIITNGEFYNRREDGSQREGTLRKKGGKMGKHHGVSCDGQ